MPKDYTALREIHWKKKMEKADYVHLFKKHILTIFYVPHTWDTLMNRHKIPGHMEHKIPGHMELTV